MTIRIHWLPVVAVATAVAGAQNAAPQVLTLGDATRLAAANSAPSVAARYRADFARGRALESRSALLPRVTASYSDGKRTFNTASFGLPLPGIDPTGKIIGPVRTVDVRGRVVANLLDAASYGRLLVARASVDAADLEATNAAQMSGAAAAAVYVRAMRADAQVRARAADSALARELLGIAQRQLEVGVGVALDVTRARAQLAGIRSQLIGARSERDRSRLELARVLGLDGSTRLSLRDSLPAGAPADSIPGEAAAIALAQGRRSDVGVAAAATETARRGLWAVRAERLPSIGVFGDDGLTSNGYANLLGTYSYGLQVTLPLFEGFRIQSHTRQAEALLHEAQARQHDVERQVATDVRSAVIELASSREQVGAAQERLTLGEQELSQARERFRAGVAGNADIIIAQLNLSQARSQYVDALAALQMARVSLARAQGRVTELP